MKKVRILLIEDDKLIASSIIKDLEGRGFLVTHANSVETAREEIKGATFDLALVDLDLSPDVGKEGFLLLPDLISRNVVPVILTGNDSNADIERAYELGCKDYLLKPYDIDSILRVIKNLKKPVVQARFKALVEEKFLTRNEVLKQELERIKKETLYSEVPIFIHGPTGVGKTKLAQIIHESVHGDLKKFVELNCSNLKEDLLEDELFGHKKDAFTGATTDKKGKLEEANGGTLFLDEIGTMSLNIQQKLLKAIEEKSFYPLGSNKKVSSNFRIISATCDNIFEKISKKTFREDFYFRISGANINLLPLSERKEDVELLVDHFKQNFGRALAIDKDAVKSLCGYSWPGNIREIQSFFSERKEMDTPIIRLSDLPKHIRENRNPHRVDRNTLITKAQLNYIRNNGLKSFIEEIELEAFKVFKKESKRQTMRFLEMGSTKYYRLEEKYESLEAQRRGRL